MMDAKKFGCFVAERRKELHIIPVIIIGSAFLICGIITG